MTTKTGCLLNGGDGAVPPDVDGLTETVADLLRARGWTADIQAVRTRRVQPCNGCFACWVATPGICIIDDAGRDIARRVAQSDLAVFVTPVTFGGYSSVLKNAVDRLIPLTLPYFKRINGEVHHVPRYERYPRLLAVGVTEEGCEDAKDVFRRVVERNSINLHSPKYAACFVHPTDENRDAILSAAIEEVLG